METPMPDPDDPSPRLSARLSEIQQVGSRSRTDSHFDPTVQCSALGFVDNEEFNMAVGAIIGSNIMVLWGETDAPHWHCWAVLDHVFLLIFVVEIGLRLVHRGLHWFRREHWWAAFDTVIIGLGIVDLWITPLILRKAANHHHGRSSILRFLRLLRLLRLLRVFKMFPKLMHVCNAIIEVLGTFAWIFSVLFLFMVCCAIVLTHLLGHGDAIPDRADMREEKQGEAYEEARFLVQTMFKDVISSVFTLFQVTTTDNWDGIAYPVIFFNWKWRLFFVFYIAFASWTMISVLTAVAADNMIAATSDRKEMERREQDIRQRAFISFLRNAFYEADTDGNGLLDLDEFDAMVADESVTREMGRLGVSMTDSDLRKAWHMLDIDDSGELTIDEFVSGLAYLQEGLSTKHVISIDYSLKRVAIRLSLLMDQVGTDIATVRDLNDNILSSLKRHEISVEQMQLFLWLWHQWAKLYDPAAIPPTMAKDLPDAPPPLRLEAEDTAATEDVYEVSPQAEDVSPMIVVSVETGGGL